MMKHSISRAFTLIELLVVIAIIAILAAILFPVFAQAKLAAKKASDLSQIKQLGTATTIYLSDNDDYYPRMCTVDAGGWGSYPANMTMWSSSRVIGPYLKNTQMFVSPVDSVKASVAAGWYPNMPADRPWKQMSYMANAFSSYTDNRTAFGIANPQGVFTIDPNYSNSTSSVTSATAINKVSSVVMFANGLNEYYGQFYASPDCMDIETDYCYFFKGVYDEFIPHYIRLAAVSDPMYKAWRKFSGRANFVFTDTSAKSLSPDDVDKAERWIINAP